MFSFVVSTPPKDYSLDIMKSLRGRSKAVYCDENRKSLEGPTKKKGREKNQKNLIREIKQRSKTSKLGQVFPGKKQSFSCSIGN